MEKTSIGIQENIACVLCYILGWITGLVFLVAESENKTVKFHAMQSIVVFGGLHVLSMVLLFTVIGAPLVLIVNIIMLIAWIVLMIKAYQGGIYKFPVAGDLAEKWIQGNKSED